MHKCYELSVSVGVSGGTSPAWSSSQRPAVAHRVLGRWSPALGAGSGVRAGRGRGACSGWNRREVAHSPGSSGAGWHPVPAAEQAGEQGDRWGWRMRGHRIGRACGPVSWAHHPHRGQSAQGTGTLYPWCFIIAWVLHLPFWALGAPDDLGDLCWGFLPGELLQGLPCGQVWPRPFLPS